MKWKLDYDSKRGYAVLILENGEHLAVPLLKLEMLVLHSEHPTLDEHVKILDWPKRAIAQAVLDHTPRKIMAKDMDSFFYE